jgi:hypothetical protein
MLGGLCKLDTGIGIGFCYEVEDLSDALVSAQFRMHMFRALSLRY